VAHRSDDLIGAAQDFEGTGGVRLKPFPARRLGSATSAEPSPLDVFVTADALAINRARLRHLATLGLELSGKAVLEVGAGIGLHTSFFLERNCALTITDGNRENVEAIRQRFPGNDVRLLDLDRATDMAALGRFDIVYCYGTLYHLRHPDQALARLAAVCRGQILVETIVAPGAHAELHLVKEPPSSDQAVGGVGCRPTRRWVFEALARHFGYAYATMTQPDHPDFETDWTLTRSFGNMRAVFVGSRIPLVVPALTAQLPTRHRR
jgi:SAM-dependent methyltransferase